MAVAWTSEPDEAGLRVALAAVAPDLATLDLQVEWRPTQHDPLYWNNSAWLGSSHVVKFAWSESRGALLRRERVVLSRLRALDPTLEVPVVVAASDVPTFFVTRAVDGVPLSGDRASALSTADRRGVAEQLGGFLARLHALPIDPVVGDLAVHGPRAQSDTVRLRERFHRIVDGARAHTVLGWCDWVDGVFATPSAHEPVLAHGDLHGHNQVWDEGTWTMRCILDLGECGAVEPEFDLRYLPDAADSVDLLLDVVDAYRRASGRAVALDRVVAWHVLTNLGDALWRTEAGVDLPDGRVPWQWVDSLDRRLHALEVI